MTPILLLRGAATGPDKWDPPGEERGMRSTPDLPNSEGLATYRIRIRGVLDVRWARDMSGMHLTEELSPTGTRHSILEGPLPDQAALLGVLNALYELHLPVLSVECLDRE